MAKQSQRYFTKCLRRLRPRLGPIRITNPGLFQVTILIFGGSDQRIKLFFPLFLYRKNESFKKVLVTYHEASVHDESGTEGSFVIS